jgi:hypothetical protein
MKMDCEGMMARRRDFDDDDDDSSFDVVEQKL